MAVALQSRLLLALSPSVRVTEIGVSFTVLDDTTLDVLLRTLDTIKDFVEYLKRKERFITAGKLGGASGEEVFSHIIFAMLAPTAGTTSFCQKGQTSSLLMRAIGLVTSSIPSALRNSKRTKSVTIGTG